MSENIKGLTCIECPMGCSITVRVVDGVATEVSGNNCVRGKLYAENEVVCPKRVITTTVRLTNGDVVPVKTTAPVDKSKVFEIMQKINKVVATVPVRIGDVLVEDIGCGASLVATDDRD